MQPAPVLSIAAAVTLVAIAVGAAACASAPSTGAPKEVVERGKALYEANCRSCHGGASGGALRDIPPPHNKNGHTWHHADQLLIDIVLNGVSIPNYEWKMPRFKDTLTEADAQAIIAHIKSWWTADQRAFQATATAQYGT